MVMGNPLWFVNLLKKMLPLRFILAKLSKIPIIGKIMNILIFEGVDIIYLTKDRVIQQVIQMDRTIEKQVEMILPSRIIKTFIEKSRYHFIVDLCICRDSNKCKDYPIELGCLFLGDAVLGINPQLGRLVTKDEAWAHIKRCSEAGLVHMIGIDKLDALWLNVSPENKLLSICSCCPCCCLWKMTPYLKENLGVKIRKMPGIRIRINRNKCIGSGTCTKGICFLNAIHIVNDKAVINKECRGCGRCVEICPQQAIEISIGDERFFEKSVNRISSLVDVS